MERISRRAWTLLLAAAPLLAQSSAPPIPAADAPDQKRQKAITDVRGASDRLAETELPMSVEPSFIFRVY